MAQWLRRARCVGGTDRKKEKDLGLKKVFCSWSWLWLHEYELVKSHAPQPKMGGIYKLYINSINLIFNNKIDIPIPSISWSTNSLAIGLLASI